MQKRAYIAFWANLYSLQDRTNLWKTDLPRHEKHRCVTAFADPRLILEKQRIQKTQFSKGIFWRSFVERKTKETFVLLNDEVTEAWYLPLVLLFI